LCLLITQHLLAYIREQLKYLGKNKINFYSCAYFFFKKHNIYYCKQAQKFLSLKEQKKIYIGEIKIKNTNVYDRPKLLVIKNRKLVLFFFKKSTINKKHSKFFWESLMLQ